MLSASQFATCNFLIGKNFNILPSPSPVFTSIPFPALQKLEILLTALKSFTSKFLIDNWNGFSSKPSTLSAAEGSRPVACSSLACPPQPWRRRTGPPHVRPFPALKHLAAKAVCSRLSTVDSRLLSNRPSPRLEIPVSPRKQTIAPIPNRPKFAFCNSRPLAALKGLNVPSSVAVQSRLLTLDYKLPPLIANDMHSRKSSTACKQSTYQILIANEFHSARSFLNLAKGPLPARPAWPIMVPRSALISSQEESWLRRNP